MLILAIIGGVVLIAAGVFAYLTLHKAPSCMDGKQNADEEGVDCGGSCTYLCSAGLVNPSALFVRSIRTASGRTDVIAYIKNPNLSAAAKGVPYTIELYNAAHAVIASRDGIADLAPASDTVVYIPNFFSGGEAVDRAFLSFTDASYQWFRYDAPPQVPAIANPQVTGTAAAPRVEAKITNPFPTTLRNIKLFATVFDSEGNAIAASQTLIPELPPQGQTSAVFTWNEPFAGEVSRIEVKPAVPLPNP